jgi:hypothetical protein
MHLLAVPVAGSRHLPGYAHTDLVLPDLITFNGCRYWLWPTITLTEKEILATAGLDALVSSSRVQEQQSEGQVQQPWQRQQMQGPGPKHACGWQMYA